MPKILDARLCALNTCTERYQLISEYYNQINSVNRVISSVSSVIFHRQLLKLCPPASIIIIKIGMPISHNACILYLAKAESYHLITYVLMLSREEVAWWNDGQFLMWNGK